MSIQEGRFFDLQEFDVAANNKVDDMRGVEGVYQRSDMLNRRRPLMEAWAQHVQLR